MRPDDLILRGFAVPDGDSYFAICLDLNIYARGESPAQAIEKCRQFVCEYVNEAVNEDIEHVSDLLRRRAPFRFWAMYRLMQLLIAALRLVKRDTAKPRRGGLFETPLPVHISC